MSALFGGLLVFGGSCTFLSSLSPDAIVSGDESSSSESKWKKVTRVVANCLNVVGRIALAIGMITIGSAVWHLGSTIGFLEAFQQGFAASLPYLVASLTGLGTGKILHVIAQ